jgi:predicted nucleic acid-binding protein
VIYLIDTSALARLLRDQKHSRGVDLMIAATAAHHGLTLLHDDADYRTVARHSSDLAEQNVHDLV